ncbi:Cro/CI family transcriptional regulator [Pseudomonas putida]|uniref:Cro/CI family transcriptional regulator n=1 Tax=Pseudomonas putida TaxID=303 RepID=UPI001869FF6C
METRADPLRACFNGKDVALADFIRAQGRSAAAKALGCTPPALSKAIGASREIYVVVQDCGAAQAFEISRFPGRGT